MGSLIEISGVSKIYSSDEWEVRAMDNVSLKIDEAEFVAIIGDSGSGKSTLMNVLGCLDIPTAGMYLLGGQDVTRLSDREISKIRNNRIGFIFQGFNLIPTLDALENVELPLVYRKLSKERRKLLALDALTKVGLSGRMHHRPSQMSGGQQQRVAIARAIAAKPPIILADEPTGNLDSNSGNDVLAILTGLWNEGKTVIIITHDDKVASRARRIIRVTDGKITDDYYQNAVNQQNK